MAQYSREAVFDALADDTRRRILDLLADGEQSAGQLSGRFSISRPAISRHLRTLRDAGLVHCRAEAQWRIYSLNADALREADRWIAKYRVFWGARLQDLRRVVEKAP